MAEKQQTQQGAQQPAGGQELIQRGQRRRGRGPGMGMRPFEDMERMMEGFFPRGWMRPFGSPFEPREATASVDVIERDADVIVRAEMPGVAKENLDVSVREGVITLHGRMDVPEETQGEYLCRELPSGELTRTIQLPVDVDADKARAQIRNGILELTLPKSEGAKRRSIPIE